VVVQRADGPDAPALRREAVLLRGLAGLAVPRLLSTEDDDSGFEMVTTFRPPTRVIRLVHLAEAAVVLAHAHARATTHGAFDARCITVDQQGLVVVEGWKGNGTPADDVAALGTLLDASEPFGEPSRPLRGIIARATADEPTARPGMAALAEALERVLGSTTGQAPSGSPPSKAPGRPSLPPRATFVALAAVLASVLGVLAATNSPSRTAVARSQPGAVLTIGDGRWRVGEAGDVAVAGDWDCDGADEPVVLRADGTVWRWRHLDSSAELVGRAPSGAALDVDHDDQGCDQAVVRDQRGERVAIRPVPGPTEGPPRSPATVPAR
jgi:hypothetical protein